VCVVCVCVSVCVCVCMVRGYVCGVYGVWCVCVCVVRGYVCGLWVCGVCVSCQIQSKSVYQIEVYLSLYETLCDAHTGLQSSIELDVAQTDISTTLCEISAWFFISINAGRRLNGVEQRVAIMDIDINR